MKIGLTFDLRSDYLKAGYSAEETAEFDKEETIDGIENSLNEIGFYTERIGNVQSLIKALQAGKKWDIVFNICEGMYGEGRESLVPALLDAYKIRYVFSGPVTLGISLNKAFSKHIIRDAGILTPDFFVVHKIDDVDNCNLSFPLFAKPVAEGTGKGIEKQSVITTAEELKEVSRKLLRKFRQPVLIETFLSGREFTVGVVGNGNEARIIGAMEIIYEHKDENIYSMYNKENYESFVNYEKVTGDLLNQCADISLNAWKVLNCFDGGRVDLRADEEGNLNFLEINPLAGLNHIHSDLPIMAKMNGISFTELINQIVNAAISRYGEEIE